MEACCLINPNSNTNFCSAKPKYHVVNIDLKLVIKLCFLFVLTGFLVGADTDLRDRRHVIQAPPLKAARQRLGGRPRPTHPAIVVELHYKNTGSKSATPSAASQYKGGGV